MKLRATFDGDKTLLVVNPAAGGGRVGDTWDELGPRLAAALGTLSVYQTKGPGDAVRTVAAAVQRGIDTVLSLGGDGTHGEVLNGIMRSGVDTTKVRLGILHAGTGGDFRRMLNGGGALSSTLEGLARAGSKPIDVGSIHYVSDEGAADSRYFLNIAAAGLAGEVDRRVNRSSKKLGGRLTFLLATLSAFARYKPPTVRIRMDGTDLGEQPVTNICVANARWAGGGMMLAPSARLADGLLELVIYRPASMARGLALTRQIYRGEQLTSDLVDNFRGREIRLDPADVNAEPVVLDIDGESPGRLPAVFKVHAGAIRLLDANPDFL